MKKLLIYTRTSHQGNPYTVAFTVEVTPEGFASIYDAEFSLREILTNCLEEVTDFVRTSMAAYNLGVAEFGDRVNHGHPTKNVNHGGFYYTVDGKLYRCDKKLSWVCWSAPVSDLFRILIALGEGKDKGYGLSI